MSSDPDRSPVYASPLLWGAVLVVALAGGVADGVWTGAALLLGSLGGVVAVALLERGIGLLRGRGTDQRNNVIDPWED